MPSSHTDYRFSCQYCTSAPSLKKKQKPVFPCVACSESTDYSGTALSIISDSDLLNK